MRILAIETSCDETSVAIAEFSGKKSGLRVRVLSHIVLSQIPVHKKFGGVVPNLARREHEKNLVPISMQALKEAGFLETHKPQITQITNKTQNTKHKTQILERILEREPELLKQFLKKIAPLEPPPVDAIAVTYGPGLAPALWVGVNFARALSFLWDIPIIPVNHMAGHFFSAFLQKSGKENSKFEIQNSKFPILGLLVSGGHTELVLMPRPGRFRIVGETLDDAAGEAFDKVARILGLPYPGGPFISALAEMKLKVKNEKVKIKLPRPMLNTKDHNFSFSGLKTAVLYLTRDLGTARTKKFKSSIAKEFQDAAVEVLVKKTVRAVKAYNAKTVLLGGGVSANRLLRESLHTGVKKDIPGAYFMTPDPGLTGDNALMIAVAAYFSDKKTAWRKLRADANLRLGKN